MEPFEDEMRTEEVKAVVWPTLTVVRPIGSAVVAKLSVPTEVSSELVVEKLADSVVCQDED